MRRSPRAQVTPISSDRNLGTQTSLEALERRLDDGYARIDEARARGEDVTAWENFWIDLLHQYEAAHNDVLQAA